MAAQEMLGVALEAERQAYLERHAGAVDGEGRRVVTRGTAKLDPCGSMLR